MPSVNLEGLSDDQLVLVQKYVNVLRSKPDSRQEALASLRRLLNKLNPPSMTEQEVDQLAQEAVAYARGRL